MNEKLDLVEILKDCPKGTKLYLSTLGCYVSLEWVDKRIQHPIRVIPIGSKEVIDLTRYGQSRREYPDGDCILWPSKECRDWSKFKVPVEKFDYSTLKPFDKVLVRDIFHDEWRCALFTCMINNSMFCSNRWKQGIPYNDETKHLAGTTDKPDEKYIWWEEEL